MRPIRRGSQETTELTEWTTAAIEADIRKLSSQSSLSASDQASLAALKSELAHITKTKADCQSLLILLSSSLGR